MNLHETAASLLSYALQSGFLLIVGLLLPRLLKIRHPRLLLTYWQVLLVLVVFLPLLLAGWTPPETLPVLRLEAGSVETVVASALPTEVPWMSPGSFLIGISVVTFLGLIRLAGGFVFLKRCRRRARPLHPLPDKLDALKRRFGLEVPFLVSDRLTAPLTFGWLRPTVLVPGTFRALSEDEQEAVACHELIHIRRRDWAKTVFEEVLRTFLWFHPAVWILLPKIALSREKVVDAGTVRFTGKRKQYLEALWRTVVADRRSAAALAIPLLGKSNLFERVEWLRKERKMGKKQLLASIFVAALALSGAGFIGAAVFPAATEDVMDSAPVDVPVGLNAKSSASGDKPGTGGDEDQLKRADGGDPCGEITHPVIREKVAPVYPESARKEKVMGMVNLKTVVTEDGKVAEIEVAESPDERLSQAAIDAVSQWTFDPALCDGNPVGVYYHLTVNFRLK